MWGEMETGPCLEETVSQSAEADVGKLSEADKMGLETDGDTGMDGEERLATGEMDSRVEIDIEQLACGEAVVDPGAAAPDWKMDGGAETISGDANEAATSPFSSAAPCQEEEERVMEEEQAGAEEGEEVGMETSEDNSAQGEELTQRC